MLAIYDRSWFYSGTSLTSITTYSPGDPQAQPQAQPWYMDNPSGTAVLDSHMGMSVGGGAENWPPEHCVGSGGLFFEIQLLPVSFLVAFSIEVL